MRLKLYRAASVAEAMGRIRAELGPDALILASRRVGAGVEVTAALEPAEAEPVPAAPAQAELVPAPPPLHQVPADPVRAAALAWHAVPAALAASLDDGPLEQALAGALSFAALPLGAGERPLLLAGPPGAGKTLTAARLATRLVLAGTPPLVITADGKRAGAAEQLAAFTRLLGLELIVACHPVTLGRALARSQNGAPVLIDAPPGAIRSTRPSARNSPPWPRRRMPRSRWSCRPGCIPTKRRNWRPSSPPSAPRC